MFYLNMDERTKHAQLMDAIDHMSQCGQAWTAQSLRKQHERDYKGDKCTFCAEVKLEALADGFKDNKPELFRDNDFPLSNAKRVSWKEAVLSTPMGYLVPMDKLPTELREKIAKELGL